MSSKSLRIRVCKNNRFFKPYSVQVSINHSSYLPLILSDLGLFKDSKDRHFWTEKKARKYIEKTFEEELNDGAKIVSRIHKYKD